MPLLTLTFDRIAAKLCQRVGHKPNSVPRGGGHHFSAMRVATHLQRSTRGLRRATCTQKRASPYVTLLQAGFGQPACHHAAGALLPHHFTLAGPPAKSAAASGPRPTCRSCTSRRSRRCSFCATFRRVAPPGGYPAPCPGEFGLSSDSADSHPHRPR